MGRAKHDVELVEDTPDEDASRPAARGRGRRLLVPVAAVLVAAGVVAVVGQVVVERREAARVAAVADVEGVLDPVDGPLQVRWEGSEDVLGGLQARTPDGLLVGVRPTTDGPVRATAVDPATGEDVWVVDLLDGTGRRDGPAGAQVIGAWSGTCAPVPRETSVVCLADDGWRAMVSDTQSGFAVVDVPPSTARLVVLDGRDGALLEDLSEAGGLVGPGASRGAGPLVLDDGTVLLVTHREDGSSEVTAVGLDGRRTWRAPLTTSGSEDSGDPFLYPLGGLVAAVDDTEVLLLDARGHEVRRVPLDGREPRWLSDEAIALVAVDRDTGVLDRNAPLVVLTAAGQLEIEGEPVYVTVDDDSVPGMVLTTVAGRLVAWDADGDRLWTSEVPVEYQAMVLDGRVHADSGSQLLTLDARTGEELWRSKATSEMPVTDGRYLLAQAPGIGGRPIDELVALDPADGSELWRSPLPEGTEQLSARFRLLVGYSSGSGSEVPESRFRVLGAP